MYERGVFHVHHWGCGRCFWWRVCLFGRFVNNDYLIFDVCECKDCAVVTNNCHKSQLIKFMRRTEDVDAQYNCKTCKK